MFRPTVWLLLAVAAVGGWCFFQNYRIEGVGKVRFVHRDVAQGPQATASDAPPVARAGDSIRIASFNLQVFGEGKLDKPVVMDILARIVRRFDVVAVQEICSQNQDVAPRLVDLVNAAGRQYDYVIGERLGRAPNQEQYAFLFDRSSVELDRSQVYAVADPDDLLQREPLVGWFRVRGPPADEAFTFTLVNVHVEPDEGARELNVLDDVFRAVRDDGRDEDDVILLGDLDADDRNLGELARMAGMAWAVSATPTNTRGDQQCDNIIFHQQATREFSGRSGVFDFMREYNLTLAESLEVSDHLPVWAEFSVYEGGQAGRVAARRDP